MDLKIIIITSIILLVIISFYIFNNKEDLYIDLSENEINVAIVSMMKNPKNIDEWISLHELRGITKFYIRLEDSPDVALLLKDKKNIYLENGSSLDIPHRYYDTDYPGELQMRRQRDWVQRAIDMSIKDNIHWLIHIDSDEIVDCEGKIQYHIKKETLPNKHCYIINNYEAKYSDIPGKNDSCFTYKSLQRCANGGCVSYANGKGMGRVSPKLKEFGVHRFIHGNFYNEVELKGIRLLHFESCDFDQYVNKYLHLSKTDKDNFPFEFYNESIKIAKSDTCKEKTSDCLNLFERIYKKYKVIEDFFVGTIENFFVGAIEHFL